MVDMWRIRYERRDSSIGILYLREFHVAGNGVSVRGFRPFQMEHSLVFPKSVALAVAAVLRRFGYSADLVRSDMRCFDFVDDIE